MKRCCKILFHVAKGLLTAMGLLFLLFLAMQFTNLPWCLYRSLFEISNLSTHPPTQILVMGGSGIPGESGLMRTFYGAQAARLHPDAEVLVAMPLGASESEASQTYLNELLLRGVPSNRVHILPDGRNTREQAMRMKEHLGEQASSSTVLVVTNPEHIRRTVDCLRRVGFTEVAAMPAHTLSIEDPLPWNAAELDTPESLPAARSIIPDIGASLHLRYDLWNNLGYTQIAIREYMGLLYYRLRGWV